MNAIPLAEATSLANTVTSQPRFIVADTSIPHRFPLDADALTSLVSSAQAAGYRAVDVSDGVTLLTRR
ncbi:hypothetical protein B7R22_13480 [Subtercola boreus]|uniref:Uncharacterized protein n=1 Tax=Subtercola boreus TaxID=120213 RepID=A0A3E0VWC3_9MICO|nr:hypothetical protein B7R22_13480 [Subtercola boreus]